MEVVRARYRSLCAICGKLIAPGDRMASVEVLATSKWAHVPCHPETAADALLRRATATGAPRQRRSPARMRTPRRSSRKAARSATSATRSRDVTEVYTDGACSGNPGPGGWAWAVDDGRQASGGESPSTNQRMEIRAALEAVRSLDGPLVVVSDSTYVVNCFRDKWWRGWLRRGWQNAARRPVANRDLWEPLVEIVGDRGDVTFRWVKGHSGDPMNELVDSLAVAAAAAALRTGRGGTRRPRAARG